jgi:uncharacterized protein YhfF
MPVPPHIAKFWSAFTTADRRATDERFYEAFYFGDSQALAHELAELVLRGKKGATAAALWSFEAEGKRVPEPGDLSVVTDWSGEPLCVIETKSIDVMPFHEVTADFAATEGEGDGSLAFWRHAHAEYFTRECQRAGREFDQRMLVVCERFEVVFRGAERAG